MRNALSVLRRAMAADRRAVTSLEYGMIGALVFLLLVVSVNAIGIKLIPVFTSISSAL